MKSTKSENMTQWSLSYSHLFGEEVCADGGLILVGELLVNVLVHQRRLAHARVAEDDHLN